MAFDNIANVTMALQTTATSVAGFSTPLFLTAHRRYTDRVRSYSTLAEVADDFEVTDNAYVAAQTFFSANPKPDSFKVGRIAADALFDVGEVAEDVVFAIELGVNENGTSPVSYTALAADDEEAVVDALILAIDALYDDELIVTKVGSGATTQLSIVPATSSDNFVLGELTNLTVALTISETAVQAKNAAEDVDSDFFWVTSELKDETSVLALASDTAATNRHYITSSSDTDSLVAIVGTPTDTLGQLSEFGYERVSAIFHQDDDRFPELGVISEFTTVEPGTKDYYAKAIEGFGASRNPDTGAKLTSTEQDALIARNVNAIVTQGGVDIFVKGLAFSGNQLSNLVFRDFYVARLNEGYTAWRIARNKIPFDQTGIDSAESVFRTISNRYLSTPERAHAIESYVTNFPRVSDVSFNDKSNGLLRAVATVYLTGSIFTVDLDGVLTYNANF